MKKTALITGATSGIGEACARKFAEGGYNLILTARRAEKLAEIKEQLEAEGTKVAHLGIRRARCRGGKTGNRFARS